MRTLLLIICTVVGISSHAQQQTIVITPKSGNQQGIDSLNDSIRNLGDSFQRSREMKLRQEQLDRDYELRKEQAETDRELAQAQIKALNAESAKAKEAAPSKSDDVWGPIGEAILASREATAPAAPKQGRFQLLNSVIKKDGQEQTLILKMDTATGQTWEYSLSTSGTPVWSEVNADTPPKFTPEQYETAAEAFDRDGKTELAKQARARAQSIRDLKGSGKDDQKQRD